MQNDIDHLYENHGSLRHRILIKIALRLCIKKAKEEKHTWDCLEGQPLDINFVVLEGVEFVSFFVVFIILITSCTPAHYVQKKDDHGHNLCVKSENLRHDKINDLCSLVSFRLQISEVVFCHFELHVKEQSIVDEDFQLFQKS